MYDLTLTEEQVEIRDTVREFVRREIKPVMLSPARLEKLESGIPRDLLVQASNLGLRTLALSEEAGGAGADSLTCCIVAEELGAGDAGFAASLMRTAALGQALFEGMSVEQHDRVFGAFLDNPDCHLAHAPLTSSSQWSYHRTPPAGSVAGPAASQQADGTWRVSGRTRLVANALLAGLYIVQARTGENPADVVALVVPREMQGLTVTSEADGDGASVSWHHSPAGVLVFEDCRIPAENQLGSSDTSGFERLDAYGPAVNLGLGRAAYEAALDYAKLRVQGGKRIVEHQAIGNLLAGMAIRLEAARSMVWKAAWASDHPDACPERSAGALHNMAKVFTSEAVYEIAMDAAECFGAMGVMRDMPLQKYVADALAFLHVGRSNNVAKLRIAEAEAGYEAS